MTLPPLLVEQLREALSGDLRAERDLLRSTLADALGGLHKATEAIEAGLSLSSDDSAVRRSHVVGGRDTVSGQNRKPGVLILRRLDVMQEFRDELPALITAEDLRKFLVRHGDRPDLTVHAAGNILWSLDAMGLGIERKGRGVYGWAA